MKQLLILPLLILFNSIQSYAQKGQPAFGKIDKADLEMKDCDFDHGAEAVTLIDWGNVYYEKGYPGVSFFSTIYERRIRIKILKEKGLSYADVKLPYYGFNNNEAITKVSAYTYNLDESGNIKTTEVSKSSIYTRRITNQHTELVIAFPEAKVGSVIEYRYKMERRRMGDLKDWYFQSEIPTVYSEYHINVPALFRFTIQPVVVDNIETKQEEVDDVFFFDDGSIATKILKKSFIMRNLRGIRDEPYMASADDYMQRLEFHLSQIDYGENRVVDIRTKWSDVVKNELLGDADFGKQVEDDVFPAATVIAQAKYYTDPESKIKFLYNFVRTNMQWNGHEGIYSFGGLANVMEKKTGSTADINLLLINLLRHAGVQVYPILFSTRDNGLVSTSYPSVRQFNTVMAYAKGNDKYYVLDATDRFSSYKLIPATVVNTRGFRVEADKSEWIDIIDSKNKYKVMAALHGVIDTDGVMKADGLVNCSGYAKKERCKTWMMDKEKFKQDYFPQNNNTKIEELIVNNVEADSLPLEQKVKFNSSLNSSGDYRYFSVNLFAGLEKNPFVADERQTDVDFGYQQEYQLFGNYTIPDGYVFDALPENISLVMPDNSIVFNRFLNAEDNMLNVRITLEFRNSFYTTAIYPEFKEFYKKLFMKLNEQIVIKKKATP